VVVDEHFERRFVAAGDKPIQQFAIPDLGSFASTGNLGDTGGIDLQPEYLLFQLTCFFQGSGF
jgi:hypothetical protein